MTLELKRVLKPGGVMFWNHGDSYGGTGAKDEYRDPKYPNGRNQLDGLTSKFMQKCMLMQNYRLILKMIDEQGWILRNTIIWHKPNHMPSSVRDRFTSSYEPIFMLVKSQKYWFDLDAVRVPHKTSPNGYVQYENVKGKAWGDHSKDNIMGAESKKVRCQHPSGKNPGDVIWKEQKSKIYYEASQRSGHYGEHRPIEAFRNLRHPLGKNPGDFWTIPTQPFPEAHFAVYPEKLIEPLIKAGCPEEICKKCGKARERITEKKATLEKGRKVIGLGPKTIQGGREGTTLHHNIDIKTIGWTDCGCNVGFESGIVLDPFIGAGTTALVALKNNRRFIGFELSPGYCKIAEQRIRPWVLQEKLEV
jgi:hypothetical protein